MVLQNGDFVKINYTGKIKETGKVFDTTLEKVAKENNIYDERVQFKAAPIVVGANHVLRGLDEALLGAEVGETKIIEVPPEKGYGNRDPKLVKVVPVKDFTRQGMRAVPGMRVEADGRTGKIQSVGAGRVRIDFNYELAGKTLVYEINVEEKVNKPEEKIRLLLERNFFHANPNNHEIEIKEGKVVLTLSDEVSKRAESIIGRQYLIKDIFKFLDVTEVEIREIFKK